MDEVRDAAIEQLKDKHLLYKRLFETEDGEAVMKDLKNNCYYDTTTFSTDPGQLAYREGMRCVLLHINTMVNLDTEVMKNVINSNSDGQSVREEGPQQEI